MKNIEVTLRNKNGNQSSAILSTKVEQGNFLLYLKSSDLEAIAVSASNFFEGLINIRLELEKQDYLILCQGAVKNVYPSRMSAQMGGALKAYKLMLGKQASVDDLVNIFDPAQEDEVVSVDEQKNYFLKWIRSLEG